MFFVLTAALSGTFSNLLIPLNWSTWYGFRFYEYAYWLFFSLIMILLFAESGPANSGWTIYPPLSALPHNWWFWFRYDIMVGVGYFHCIALMGSLNYIVQFEDRGMSMTRLPLTIWSFLFHVWLVSLLYCYWFW
jgi:cytochrome c oxidase subunit 1